MSHFTGISLCVCLLLCGVSQAAGPVRGVVRGASTALPGAIVTATKGETKIATTTDDTGSYQFDALDAGEWAIQVRMFGFQPSERKVTIGADAQEPLDWALEVRPRPAPARQATTLAQPTSWRFWNCETPLTILAPLREN